MTNRLLTAVCLLCGTLAACTGGAPGAPCVDIPAGGCPTQRGADVCQDVTCSAVYDCNDGHWVLQQTCPPHGDSGAADGSGVGHDAATADAAVDAPPGAFGGPGCVDLQPPDCSLGSALACGGASDCCGCQDLFVCADGGWTPWGQCVDGGAVEQH